MVYSVDWIEKNMGITRKTLRVYEEKKLLSPVRNSNNNYREYSDEDLNRIWEIKVLQDLGYSVKEIIYIKNNQDFNFKGSIEEKITKLEEDKDKLEKLIGYAKAIKVLGRIPEGPKKMGSMKFKNFIQCSHQNWNINSDPQIGMLQQLTEKTLKRPEDEWTEEEFNHLLDLTGGLEGDTILTLNALYNALAKRKNLEVSHPEVQTIVKELYDYFCKLILSKDLDIITPQKFVDLFGGTFTDGDLALMNEKTYGIDTCKFIDKALEYFGEHAECTDNE